MSHSIKSIETKKDKELLSCLRKRGKHPEKIKELLSNINNMDRDSILEIRIDNPVDFHSIQSQISRYKDCLNKKVHVSFNKKDTIYVYTD